MDPSGCSSEDLSTLDDVESISLPSLPDSVDGVSLPLDGREGGPPPQQLGRTISERRLGRKIPSLVGEREISQIGRKLEKAKITDGPVVHKTARIVVKKEGGGHRGGVPVVSVLEVTEEEEADTPPKDTPRVRRVSDVIDSLGNSAPSSPRTPGPPSAGHNGFPKTSPVLLPNGNTGSRPAPAPKKRIPDRTDSAPMGNYDESDAQPFADEEYEEQFVCARMPVEKNSEEYNMGHGRRGRAVIFNHVHFERGYEPREGSDKDAAALEATLESLGFQVDVYHNLEYEEIKKVIAQLKAEDHSDADCLAVVVLSHGIHGGYILSRDIPYPVDFLWESFKPDVCPSLAGKPKMFFIQACRGEKMDKGVRMMRSPGRTQTDSSPCEYKIPSFADFLIAFSTVDGHYAWRNPEKGTWFIQCLCNELRENGTTSDLLSLMTATARRVALDYESFDDERPWNSEMKQVPQVTSMLIRKVYFRPKGDVTSCRLIEESEESVVVVGNDAMES